MRRNLQSNPWLFPLALAALWLVLLASEWHTLREPRGANPDDSAVARTAWVAVSGWLATAVLFFLGAAAERVRAVYVWSCAAYLLHVAVAFHRGHSWSHALAFEHVERTSGFGPGIFVSYLFTVVWFADAAWSVLALESYRSRPKWCPAAVYGFQAFIVFNAAVVFGDGRGRWLSGAAFLLLAFLLFLKPVAASRSRPG